MKNVYRSASLAHFANAWTSGKKPTTPINGIQGRFIRMAPGMPDALTDDPDRRIIFLVDSTTCTNMIGLTGYQVASLCGWKPEYTKAKVQAGYRFAFVAFDEKNCKLGSWDNMLDEVQALYPEIAGKLSRHRATLRTMTPADIPGMEKRLGYRLIDVDNAGKKDPRFMTIDRYRSAPDTADSARAFLYHTVHLKELYFGDGYTRNEQGQRGVPEYIMGARPMSDLGEHFLTPIDVILPRVLVSPRNQAPGELPMPSFYRADNAADWNYQPLLAARAPGQKGLMEHANDWRQQYGIRSANQDGAPVTMLVIDAQNDFCHPDGTLYVAGRSGTGAIDDCARTAQFIYANLGRISRVIPTMDTHLAFQIFFASFWVDGAGNPISAHRVITTEQIDRGEVRPAPAMASITNGNYAWLVKQVRHYCAELEKAGKYQLYIWPPHCILGSQGHALNGVVMEAAMFHAFARYSQMSPEVKGAHPLTENYSVFAPEVLTRHDGQPLTQRNTGFVKTILGSRAVIIAGQAASHCVKSSIDDLLTEILRHDPALAKRCYVVRDLTSAVVVPDSMDPHTKQVTAGFDFTPEADGAFARFQAAGMHLVDSTVPMSDWPDFPAH